MFDSNVLHIAEFMTVAKSLPHLWQKVRKLLISKLFLSYSCILLKNETINDKILNEHTRQIMNYTAILIKVANAEIKRVTNETEDTDS